MSLFRPVEVSPIPATELNWTTLWNKFYFEEPTHNSLRGIFLGS